MQIHRSHESGHDCCIYINKFVEERFIQLSLGEVGGLCTLIWSVSDLIVLTAGCTWTTDHRAGSTALSGTHRQLSVQGASPAQHTPMTD